MSSTRSVAQRLNNAFVSVPPSPLSLDQYRPLKGTPLHVSTKLKENTPLRPFHIAMAQCALSSPSLKRKMDDRDQPPHTTASATKKAKNATDVVGGVPLKPKPVVEEEYPNGFIYCHQCNRKRDARASVQCTSLETRMTAEGRRERRCLMKFCKSCLMKRYGENMDDIKAQRGNGGAEFGHAVGEGYIFKCPRCRDVCNCHKCRKAKGLEPLRNFSSSLRRKADLPKRDKKAKVEAIKETAIAPAVKKTVVKKLKPKALPTLEWTALYVSLSQTEAEERICIREFVQRFARIMEPPMAKANLEELDVIAGRKFLRDDNDEMVGWVSEPCLKAIIVGLLGFLADDYENNIAKIIKSHIKVLRSAGMNLNKIWKILADMRETIANTTSHTELGLSEAALTFPNPLPPPASVNIRATRSVTGTSAVSIYHAAQMIPVILSLINVALETAIVREEIDQGIKDSKDAARYAREATKRENDCWEQARKFTERDITETADIGKEKDTEQMRENAEKKVLHKTRLLDIDNALKIVTPGFAPRFSALGADHEGRMYYTLSPGYSEREAALDYLEAMSSGKPTKARKKARNTDDTDHEGLMGWSRFVAVWGDKPRGTSEPTAVDDKSTDGKRRESWWALRKSEEILKAADWISIKCGLEDGESVSTTTTASLSTPSQLKSTKRKMEEFKRLVRDLKEYAALLEWRARGTPVNELRTLVEGLEQQQVGAKGKMKALAPIPTSIFYGK